MLFRSPKEEIETRNNLRRRAGESKSRHFAAPSTKQKILGINGATGSNLGRTNGARQAGIQNGGIQNGGRRTSLDSISDDELSANKPGPGRRKINTGTVMGRFSKSPTSGSISRDGDIRSSLPRPTQRKKFGQAGKPSSQERPRFPVTYLRSVPGVFTHVEGEDPWYLQYNPGTSQMELTTGDLNHPVEDKYPDFAFNPTSVTRIIYSTENSKMVVWVTESNTITGSLPKLLLEVDKGALYNFVRFLQSKSNAEVKDQDGSVYLILVLFENFVHANFTQIAIY